MQALVFRNRFGPAALWLIEPGATDAPEAAYLPGVVRDPRIGNMDAIPSGPEGQDRNSWDRWAAYLASQPLLGDWRLQEIPDGLDAGAALGWVRRDDVAQASALAT